MYQTVRGGVAEQLCVVRGRLVLRQYHEEETLFNWQLHTYGAALWTRVIRCES